MELKSWRTIYGLHDTQNNSSQQQLRIEKESESKKEASEPKEGKIDPDNTPHHGGNTW